jgi:hypothetical protein
MAKARIYRKLVMRSRSPYAFGGGNIIEDPNLYAVAIVQPGHTPDEAINALVAELDSLRNEPITSGAAASKESVRARLHFQP